MLQRDFDTGLRHDRSVDGDVKLASSLSATPTRARRRFSRHVEVALWLVAATALGAAGFGYADAALYQSRHADLTFEPVVGATDSPQAMGGAQTTTHALPLAPGMPIARLEVPRLELSAVVAEGITSGTLRRAVGRLPGSALPGASGNVALAAHRDTFFRPLEGIQLGDEVILESASGRDSYRVEWTKIVEPDDVSVVGATDYPALTLVTCYPFYFVGDAPQRFVVRARRVDPATGSRPASTTPAAGAPRR